MFQNTTVFNNGESSTTGGSPGLPWVTTSVNAMDSMFNNAKAFNQSIGSWSTLNVYSMNYMFYVAENFNQNISNWVVTNVNPKPPTQFSVASPLTLANSPSWT
jgi:hypothetical protein